MTLQRVFIVVSIVLFGAIGVVALSKKQKTGSSPETQKAVKSQVVSQKEVKVFEGQPIEIDWKKLQGGAAAQSSSAKAPEMAALPQNRELDQHLQEPVEYKNLGSQESIVPQTEDLLPEVNYIDLLFQKNSPLPIVETLRYKSKVSWKWGKPAWLVDYASHYKTSVDFIARSMNDSRDYTVKAVSDGQQFNVFKADREFSFHLLIDLSRCKLWFYYIDPQEQECVLLKTYRVCLGRLSSEAKSGSLTPLGTYKLGSRIAVFKPKLMGMYKGKRVELMRVFGTRWVPFEREISGCSEPAKGFGVHGTPWSYDEARGILSENDSSIGRYESDGCIRLSKNDVEELYAIITTKSTTIEIVKDFFEAKLPFKERKL